MGRFLAWMGLAGVFSEETFKGREKRAACVYMGGQYFLYTLHKKPSPELSGFHHPSLIQGCSKSETRRKSGRLAGTWRGLKGAGGWEQPGWAGLVSAACGGGSPFPRRFHRVFIFLLRRYPNYSPPPSSREMGTDVPHCRNAEQLRKKLESSE